MVLCTEILADGKYKDFGEVMIKLIDVVGMYNECAQRHKGLVDYENKKVIK